jgi:3',5'-cyclic AMP phosphodiesterase CpdA
MIIDCISDLHGHYPKLECGDLLIVAGDVDPPNEHWMDHSFINWLEKQPYKKKIFVAGNHDNRQVSHPWNAFDYEYLCDSGTEFEYWEEEPHPASTDFVSIDALCHTKKSSKSGDRRGQNPSKA